MTVTILCTVLAILLIWVIILKMEINELKGGGDKPSPRGSTSKNISGSGSQGNKRFNLS
ncbi:MAG: hypothetical protein O2901_04140 [Verrucomicrobia bacterium]|nr:hypothetical protein [Verrucomicrobiota bacterium]